MMVNKMKFGISKLLSFETQKAKPLSFETLNVKALSFLLMLLAQSAFAQDSVRLPDPSDELTYKLKESLVKINSTNKNGGNGYGAGVAISKDHVITNCHVLQNSNGISVTHWGESIPPVALIADWQHDLCILKFEWANFKPVAIGDSLKLKYEQPIISISMPGDSPAPFVSLTTVKALYPIDDANVIRSGAAFAIGASGSPVFDYDGNLIGISTFKSPGRNAYFYNMSANWVKKLLTQPEIPLYSEPQAAFWDTPEDQRPFFMQITVPYQKKRWDDVEKIAAIWLQKEPNSTEAHFYAGAAKAKLGKLDLAKQHLAHALKIEPNHPASLIALGLLADQAGDAETVGKTHVALQAIDADLDEEFTEALKQK